jgi:hypothetical protein
MNHKLEKLALNAGLINYVDNETPRRYFVDGHADVEEVEKFAHLIVEECSKVIVHGGYRNPAFGEKHPLTPPEIATMIREHFEIES